MTWVKIADDMHLNAKVRGVSLAARWTYVASICRSGATQSDGEILPGDLSLIDGNTKIAKELVGAGLWETTSRGSYVVHDYLVYNRSRAQIEELSRTNSSNGAKRSANRPANRLPNRYEKHPENGSDSLPQNARSAPSATSPPLLDPEDPEREQSNASESLSESLPLPVTEIRDLMLSKLPTKWQRDANVWEECELFGRDFPGKYSEVARAIDECRRDGELPFARNLRKHMPGAAERRNGNGTHGNHIRGSAQPQQQGARTQGAVSRRTPDLAG